MAIQSIRIKNVMAFGAQKIDDKELPFELIFCPGINVIIGENGTGKTTVLKMIYAATQMPNDNRREITSSFLHNYFSLNTTARDLIANAKNLTETSEFEISNGTSSFCGKFSGDSLLSYNTDSNWDIPSVFIPTTEMLSHSNGFLALNQKYQMPFDQTQVDIIVNASLPEAREMPAYLQTILDKISIVIDGEVIQEDDEFYVLKKDGRKIRFSLEAEGLRKLGLLWKLIRNGLLEPGTILLWDEPEANLNPELFPLVVEILLELQKNGIQIFLATHSYNFAKYLEIRRTETEQVQFHNLYHSEQPGVIEASSAYRMEDLHPNHIMMADNKLLDEIYDL